MLQVAEDDRSLFEKVSKSKEFLCLLSNSLCLLSELTQNKLKRNELRTFPIQKSSLWLPSSNTTIKLKKSSTNWKGHQKKHTMATLSMAASLEV